MRTAYVIVDMSNDFVADDGGLTAGAPAQAIVPAVVARAEEVLSENGIVILAMDAHAPNDPHFALWPEHNMIGTWGAEPYGALAEFASLHEEDPAVIRIDKPEYDAFVDTELADILEEEGIDCVRLAGVCTDICVYLTAYGAYRHGYATVVSPEEVATFTDNGPLFLQQMRAVFQTEIEE